VYQERTPTRLRLVARSGRGFTPWGPAFVAAVAYIDPGNVATNLTAGTTYGCSLLWVAVGANVIAMLVQHLSAKLGDATGRNLAQVCRDELPRPVVRGLWVQAELVATATELAEVVGGALALQLLVGLPLTYGAVLTASVACALASLDRGSRRRFQLLVTILLVVVALGFLLQLRHTGVDVAAAAGGLAPQLGGSGAALVATGILGATVMPHAVYLHSDLARPNRQTARRGPVRSRGPRLDILVALGLAGLVNVAMLLVAAGVGPVGGTDVISEVRESLAATSGGETAALALPMALLVSGVVASGVGACAGQVMIQGFLRRRVPIVLRRAMTTVPAVVVLACGVTPTTALILSQVVLSFGVPLALVPLIAFTRRRDLMGACTNCRSTTAAGVVVAGLVIGLNIILVVSLLH
jgi:manganese transport protein